MAKKIIWIHLHLERSGGTTINGHLYKELKPEIEYIHLGQPWTKTKDRKISFEKRNLNLRKKAKIITGHNAYYGVHKLVPNKISRYITVIRDPADRLVSYYNSQIAKKNITKGLSFKEWYNLREKNEMTSFFDEKFRGVKRNHGMIRKIKEKLIEINEKIKGSETRKIKIKKVLQKINKQKNENHSKLENARKMLEKCWFIAITENSKEDFKILFNSIGIKKSWENYAVTGDEKTKEINPLHQKVLCKRFILDEKTREKIYKENRKDLELYNYAKYLNRKSKPIINSKKIYNFIF
jgi:hypothetical protein